LFKGSVDSVTINVGGTPTTFKAGSSVTPSEYLLIQQTLGNSSAQLVLNKSGVATGGDFSLNGRTEAQASRIVIGAGITALDTSKSLNLSGALVNYGTIDAVSTNLSVKTDTILAPSITNEKGGDITTQLSRSVTSLAPNAQSGVNLVLNATNDLVNSGMISSAGTLSLSTASGSIANNAGGTVKANSGVNLTSGSGTINNAGLVASHSGNINLNGPDSADLNVNASGGTFQADAGNINVRNSDYAGSNNINLSGGNYRSQNLNLNAGNGAITGVVGTVTGNLNSQAADEHISANTQNLILGNNTVHGDPTFASTGNISINGVNTFTESVAILAEGNITAGNATAEIIDSGNNVTLIAGATVTTTGTINTGTTTIPTTTQNLGGTVGVGNGTGTFTASIDFSLPSTNGGNVNLSSSTQSTIIDTSSGSVNGGNITIVAEANGSNGGVITLPAASNINAAGATPAGNGNVTMIAPNGITTSSISNGSNPGANNVLLVTAQPQSSDLNVVIFNQSGTQTSANPIQYGSIGSGSVSVGSSTTLNATSISITGNQVNTSTVTTTGSVSLASVNNINYGAITAPGGIIMVAGGYVHDATGGANLMTASTTGNAGNITIVDGASFTQSASQFVITGASGQAGGFADAAAASINTSSTNGNGGNINIISFGNGGNIQTGNNTTLNTTQTGGSGSHTNGNILAIAQTGLTLGDFQGYVSGYVNTSGGTGGGGNITALCEVPSSSTVVISKSTSDIFSGSFQSTTPGTGTLQLSETTLPSGAAVTLSAARFANIETFNVTAAPNVTLNATSGTSGSSGGIAIGVLGQPAGYTALTAQTINVTSQGGGGIQTYGAINVPGGILMLANATIDFVGAVSTSATNSGNLTAIAGAAFSPVAGGYQITGQSTGGNVDFTAAGTVTTASTATGGNGNGGNINAIAYGGTVNFLNAAITTGGAGTGSNGNLLMIGANGVTFGQTTNTTGNTAGGGNITAQTQTPSSTYSVSSATNDISSGSPLNGTWTAVDIQMPSGSSVTVNNAAVTMNSGRSVSLDQITGTTNSTLNISANLASGGTQGNINFNNTVSVNQITATVLAPTVDNNYNNSIGISNKGLTAPGGILLVAGGGISGSGNLTTANTSGTGNAGNLTLISGAAFTETPTAITITGASSEAGSQSYINVQGITLDSRVASGNGNGGDINLIVFKGQINQQNTSGTLVTDLTGGSGTGTNGNFTAVAAGTAGQQILLPAINTAGGQAGTGNINVLAAIPTTSPNVVLSKATSDISSGGFLGGTPVNSNIFINGGPAATINANGATVLLSSAGTLSGSGNPGLVITDNSTSGNGGSVLLTANTLDLGQASILVNASGASGKGGEIALNFGTINYPNSGSQALALSAYGSGNGMGGTIIYSDTASNPVVIGTNVTADANGGTTGSGGSVTISTQGALTVTLGSSLSVAPGTNGSGGQIFLTGSSVTGSGSGPLVISSNGNGTGSGGRIDITSLSNSTAVVLGTAAGNLELSANGNSGGEIDVSSGSTLTVNPAALNITALGTNGNGGIINLSAGSNLYVSNYLIANGTGSGAGGTIDLTSNSATPFTIGTGATTNGVNGFLGAVGQTGVNGIINITNNGGGITDNALMYFFNSLTFQAGGTGTTNNIAINSQLGQFSTNSITLSAPAGSISEIAGNTGIFATSANVSASGNIGTSTLGFALSAPQVTLAVGGQASVADPRTLGTLLTSDTTTSTGPISFSALSSITTSGALGSSGNIFLAAAANNGNVTLGGSVTSTSGSVTIVGCGTTGISALAQTDVVSGVSLAIGDTSGSIGLANSTPLQINTTSLYINTPASVAVQDSTTSLLTVTSGGNPVGAFNVQTGGALTITPSSVMTPVSSNVVAGGTITVNGVFGNGSGTLEKLTANSGGSIFLGPTGQLFGPIQLTAGGTIGTGALGSTTAIKVNSSAVTASAASTVNINDVSAGSVVLGNISGSSVGILGFSTALQTASGSSITGTNGAVTIENANTSTGTIAFGQNTTLKTLNTGGNVEVSIGAPTPGSRTTQTGFTVSGSGGTANFGNNGLTVTGSNSITLAGSSVILTSGSRPAGAFTVGGGVAITADPAGYVPGAVTTTALTQPLGVSMAPTISVGSTTSTRGLGSTVLFSGPSAAGTSTLNAAAQSSPSSAPSSGLSSASASTTIPSIVNSFANAGGSGLMAGPAVSNPVPPNFLTASAGSLGQSGIISGSPLPSTSSTTAAGQSNLASLMSGVSGANLPTAVNIKGMETPWVSETELVTGKVPAIISSDIDLGIDNEVSTVVELQDRSPRLGPTLQTVAVTKDIALVGGITRTVNGSRTMHLKKGAVVFAPTVNTIVSTEFGQVRIAAHSLVLMISFKEGVAIYDLDDQHKGAVSARVYNCEIPLGPGRHLLMTRDDVKHFQDVNPVQQIGYTNVTDFNAGGGLKVFVGGFSVPSAMQTVLPLGQLMSSNHPNAHKFGKHLMKTAALLTQMYPAQYQQMARPSITAYQQ
jgi:hypothetical protein